MCRAHRQRELGGAAIGVADVSGQQQVSISPDNSYAERSQDRDWSIFECATSVPLPAMRFA